MSRSDGVTADLDAARLRLAMGGQRIGARLEVYGRVGSTMDALAALAEAGAPEGTVLVADEQLAGRGRRGRAWIAPPGTALLLSALFRPPFEPERSPQLLMAVALAAADVAASRLPAGREVRLKWPNDLLVEGRKLGGLLAEATMTPAAGGVAGAAAVIVGLGLNVRQTAAQLPPGAISLVEAGALALDRTALAADLLARLDDYYGRLCAGDRLTRPWSERLVTLGRQVEARGPAGMVRGRAVAVTDDGALVIRRSDGRRVTVRAGEVTLGPAGVPGAGAAVSRVVAPGAGAADGI
jgi:BirA family biotin operon repressor/biotin-[acetyl-CoA-carboxylase] ligase